VVILFRRRHEKIGVLSVIPHFAILPHDHTTSLVLCGEHLTIIVVDLCLVIALAELDASLVAGAVFENFKAGNVGARFTNENSILCLIAG